MAECFRCGISGQEARLLDGIYQEGIIQVCDECSRIMDVPIIRKPTTFQLKAAEKPASVYERLARSRGLPLKQESVREKEITEMKREEVKKTDMTLKELIDRRIRVQTENREARVEKPLDLIDNFHWSVMRARRERKLTQEQLAKEIGEAEITIKMVEQGKLPEDDFRIVDKLERYFNIRLLKSSKSSIMSKEPPKRLSFDPVTLKNLTISDLKRMKDEREAKAKKKKDEEVVKDREIEIQEIEDAERDRKLKEVFHEEGEIDWEELKRRIH